MIARMCFANTFMRVIGVRMAGAAIGLLVLGGVAGCSSVNADYDARRAHHRPDGFQNRYVEFQPRGLWNLLTWRWQAWRLDLPPAPDAPTPAVAAEVDFLRRNATAGAAMQPSVTWIGHATVLAQFAGLNVITDPHFSERASPVSFLGPRRAQPPGLQPAQLPHIDIVLISHNHYDHLDEASVLALQAQAGGAPLFLVPLGLKPWFAALGITRVEAMDWWQAHQAAAPAGPVTIVFTPAQHWSGRTLADRMATLWGGFAVLAPDLHFFYSGDTGYSPDFRDIRAHFADRQRDGGFDIALIPVGAYEPRWFMREQHVNPAEAVQIHRDLGARRSLGVHWGTFNLTDEALDEPPRALARAREQAGLGADDFFVLAVGETRRLPPRAPRVVAPAGQSAP